MRIWFDTEFIEDGRTIDLVSIGMVREDGATLYLENAECDLSRASQWVCDNVLPHLSGGDVRVTRYALASRIKAFAGAKPEFWAFYASYDWVALCQIFGTMMDLPQGWPMWCRDLMQAAEAAGYPKQPDQPKDAHNALADALWNREAWIAITSSADRT